MPPPALDGVGRAGMLIRTHHADVVGSAGSSLADKSVSLRWSWRPTIGADFQHSVQKESVAFWPTDVQSVGIGKLAVAGVIRNRTVVELWTLDAVELPSAVLSQNGVPHYGELHVPIASKQVIFESTSDGMRGIQLMTRNPVTPPGAVASLFVLFFDSRNVHELTVLPGQDANAALRVASAPTPSVLVQPGLLGEFDGKVVANHVTWGYVQVFTPEYDNEPQGPTIVLYDQDRDGDLDGTLTVSPSDWISQGWSVSTSYLPLP